MLLAMHPIELVRGFLVDLWHLPVVFKAFLACGAGASAWQWWKRRQNAALVLEASGWPLHRARVVWAQVGDAKRPRHGRTYWEALVTYSYTLPGQELETGEYRRKFYVAEEADEWARGLRETHIDVRVNPLDSKQSAWTDDRAVMPAQTVVPILREESWGLRESVALLVFLVGAAGAGFSAYVQLSAFQGRNVAAASNNFGLFMGMHLGAMACGFATAFLKKGGSSLRHSGANWPTQQPLPWKIMGGYVTCVFLYCWVRMSAHPGGENVWGTLSFASIWMLFYFAAATEAWMVMRGGSSQSVQDA